MIWYYAKHFITKFFEHLTNIITIIIGVLAFCLGYPAQNAMIIMALVLFCLDVFTKIYAISKQNGGLINAFLTKQINSRSFWRGFMTKIIGYFAILVIGNFASATPQIQPIGGLMATICYTGLFMYEVTSNFENLRDAEFKGAEWFLQQIKELKQKINFNKK